MVAHASVEHFTQLTVLPAAHENTVNVKFLRAAADFLPGVSVEDFDCGFEAGFPEAFRLGSDLFLRFVFVSSLKLLYVHRKGNFTELTLVEEVDYLKEVNGRVLRIEEFRYVGLGGPGGFAPICGEQVGTSHGSTSRGKDDGRTGSGCLEAEGSNDRLVQNQFIEDFNKQEA